MATYDANTVGSDVSPSFSPQLEVQQDVTVVNLGDGYQQRILRGLNTKRRKWTLPYEKRTDAVTTNILRSQSMVFFIQEATIFSLDLTTL